MPDTSIGLTLDLSVGHGGLQDVKRHVGTANTRPKHTQARQYVKHNLPLACTDHAGALFHKMFPDSAVAAKYISGRTKTSHIADALAEDDSECFDPEPEPPSLIHKKFTARNIAGEAILNT